MPLSGHCTCAYMLSLAAVLAAQHNITMITVNVLKRDSAILSHVYKSPVSSGSVLSIWNDFKDGDASTSLGIATCMTETSQCNFAGTETLQCYCNSTHTSLKVKNNVSNDDHGHQFGSIDLQSQNFVYSLYVTVPVERVSITNVSKSTIVITENAELKLECRSSPSRPNATIKWEHNSIPFDASSEETIIDNLVEVKSIASLFPDRSMNGNNITCFGNNYNDHFIYDWVTLNVTYPPAGPPVVDHLEKNATLFAIENKDVFLNCINHDSNPPAQLDWKCEGADFVYVSDVNLTEKRLQVRASRNNNVVCSCRSTYLASATNQTRLTIEILYPPEITGIFANGTKISQRVVLIDNDTIHVSCVAEGNPSPHYLWVHQEAIFYGQNITMTNVKKSNTNTNFTCIASTFLNASMGFVFHWNDSKSFTFDVLYPPEELQVSLNTFNVKEENVVKSFSLIETKLDLMVLQCSAKGNPIPYEYLWSGKVVNSSSKLVLNLSREVRGNYTCVACNMMVPTAGTAQNGYVNQTYEVDILFPPEPCVLQSEIFLIEGQHLNMSCTVYPGNPENTDMKWTSAKDYVISRTSVLFIPNIRRDQESVYVFTVNNTMKPTYGVGTDARFKETGVRNVSFYLEVLYPPEDLQVMLNMDNLTVSNVPNKFYLIENKSMSIALNCNAQGKPYPSEYSWAGPHMNNSEMLIFRKKRDNSGTYTCAAKNIMKSNDKTSVVGMINKTYVIDMLYPPEVNVKDINVTEGDNVNISCVQIPGKTTNQFIYWKSHHTNVTNSNSLIIRNVTRTHAGDCTCVVNYTMIPTYGKSHSDIIIGVTFIDVLYKAELTNFYVVQNNQTTRVTVNENDSVTMICILDSNPSSTMQIDLRNQTLSSGRLTKILEVSISRSSCDDMGVYKCSGYNFLNKNGYLSYRELNLFVTCSPRRSSPVHVQQNVTVLPNGMATLRFNAQGYPLPVFKWWRITDSKLSEANNGNTKIQITSENELQIEFVITQVDGSDFGEYVLTMNNTFGSYQESFFLFQKDTTSAEQNYPETGIAGPVTAGIIAAIIGVVAIVGAVVLVRSRVHDKQLKATNISTTLNLSQVDQCELKDGDGIVTADSGIANVYEQLENPDVSCTGTSDSGISNVYEKLQNTGSDPQYQQLKPLSLKDNEGQGSVYENLRIHNIV